MAKETITDQLSRQRNIELQIIKSVQEGLSSRLDLKAIYELVGDQVRQVFAAQTVVIYSFDHQQKTVTHEYIHEKGVRLEAGTRPMSPLIKYVISLGNQPFVLNSGIPEFLEKYQHSCQELLLLTPCLVFLHHLPF